MACEVCFCLCESILRLSVGMEQADEKRQNAIEMFRKDSKLLGETLEKRLHVEESLSQIMIDAGIMGEVLHEILSLAMMVLSSDQITQKEENEDGIREDVSTVVEDVYCSICLLVNMIETTRVVLL